MAVLAETRAAISILPVQPSRLPPASSGNAQPPGPDLGRPQLPGGLPNLNDQGLQELRDPDAGEHGNVTIPLMVCGNKARVYRVSFGDQGTKARITPTEKETS